MIFVFRRTNRQRWWHWFLHPDYHHVTLLSLNADDQRWVLSDRDISKVQVVAMLPGETFTFCRDMVRAGARIMALSTTDYTPDNRQRVISFGMLTCVSFAMLATGVYRWWIITPYQFKGLLTRLGAIEVTGNFKEEVQDE